MRKMYRTIFTIDVITYGHFGTEKTGVGMEDVATLIDGGSSVRISQKVDLDITEKQLAKLDPNEASALRARIQEAEKNIRHFDEVQKKRARAQSLEIELTQLKKDLSQEDARSL